MSRILFEREGVGDYVVRLVEGHWIVVNRLDEVGPRMNRLTVFFSDVGGPEGQEAEALYWIERCASKNGLKVELPDAFDGVEPQLESEMPQE
jgi:hypothetical protein